MTLERDTIGASGYGFINTGYAQSFTDYKQSAGTVVTSTDREFTGQRLSRAIIDLNTFQITFVAN